MEEALAEVRRLAASSSEGTRRNIVESLRDTLYSIETQDETLNRIMFLVRRRQDSEQLFHQYCVRHLTK